MRIKPNQGFKGQKRKADLRFHRGLECFIGEISYFPNELTGECQIEGNPNLFGITCLFRAIDTQVRKIQTFRGDEPGPVFNLINDKWRETTGKVAA